MPEPIKPPNPEIVRTVNGLIDERGIYIPTESVEMVVAAMSHWLEKTKRGNEYMTFLMQLDSVMGRHENQYIEKDMYGRLTNEISPDRIVFLRGCVVNGESYPVSQIEIKKRETEACEACSCHVVCSKELETQYGKKSLCSHCASGDEDSAVRDAVDLKCESCTYSGCSWHPDSAEPSPFGQTG